MELAVVSWLAMVSGDEGAVEVRDTTRRCEDEDGGCAVLARCMV